MRFLLIVFLPVSAVTAASSREILGLLFGANYTAASEVMVLLIIAVSLAATMKLMLELLAAADRPGMRLVLVTALVPVGLALCFWLIPRYGMRGAACASMVTMAAGAVASAALMRGVIGAQLPMGTAGRCGIASLAVYAACRLWVTAGWLLVGKLLLLGVLYLALLLLLRELGRDDMDSIQRIFRGVKAPSFSSIWRASSPRSR
jgi:O-antigen/teichoic acid export membrane protein